jgi:hypothetical protein
MWRRRHSQRREPFAREAVHKVERRGGRSFARRKHPQVEKEDTVGSVTMINGAMPSTLMG